MDGYTLLREMGKLLQENNASNWLDLKMCYDLLYKAAVVTVERTNAITTKESITTIATKASYPLNPDYDKLYLMDDQNRYFIKYNDGSSDYFIYSDSFESIALANNDAYPASVPYRYAIRDSDTALTPITGTATASGALTNSYTMFGATTGESILTDTLANFSTVEIGDIVHNTLDGSHGIVIELISNTAVKCSLFDGINNFFLLGDTYIINPQSRFDLVLDPPSLISGHTITVSYVQKPIPVYSLYKRYKFPSGYEGTLTMYAAWLYKYRDREPNYGDAWFKYWDVQVRQLGRMLNQGMDRTRFGVNFIKRAGRDRTFR